MHIKTIDGIPHWVSPEGLALPMMMGGNGNIDWTDEEGATGITSLSQLANMQLFDLTRGGAPVRIRAIRLSGRTGPGGYNLEDVETGQRYFAANRVLVDTLGNAYQVSPGGDVNTGNPVQSRLLTQSERNAAVSAGIPLLGVAGSGTSGYAPQAYGSTPAGQTQAEQAALERQAASDLAAAERLEAQLQSQEDDARRNRDFARAERIAGELAAAKAAVLAARNQLKLARLSEAGALARTFEDIKSRARDVIAGMMGENPFRAAVRARGGVPRGVDPYEAFEAELGGVANMPTPQFSSESDLGQLEKAIAAMQKTQMPTAKWPMGAGGTVAPGEVVKVGELGEPEYVYNRPDGMVEVIPGPRGARIAGRAAYGGAYKFDKESIGQVLGPTYSYLGFTEAPQITRGRTGMYMGATPARDGPWGAQTALSRLGISPRLARDPASGRVYWRDPGDVWHWLSPSAAAGYDVSDMMNLNPTEMARLGTMGGVMTKPPPMDPYEGGYPQQAIPLGFVKGAREELGDYALPDPRTIANLFRTFDPANREILIDALGLSEMGREQIESLLRAFTPQGTVGRVGFG